MQDLRADFLNLQSADQLAALLQISLKKFTFLLFRSTLDGRYRSFEIAKRGGGSRVIEAPNGAIRQLQSRLLRVLDVTYRPKQVVHGFSKDRSILSNASHHVRRTYVLNVDLADFFGSINFGRVRGMFRSKPYDRPDQIATLLAQLCCHRNHLPQGAPTSPIVSNMICGRLDSELQGLAKRHRCFYTRYADDLTFSTSIPTFPQELAWLETVESGHVTRVGQALKATIEANGFSINEAKARLQRSGWHQEVTGLTVNKFINVRRTLIREIRAMLHDCQVHGVQVAQEHHRGDHRPDDPGAAGIEFVDVIRGKLEFVRAVKGEFDPVYRRYAGKFRAVDPEYRKDDAPIPDPGAPGPRDVFICHASPDKRRIVEPLLRAMDAEGISRWYDTAEIRWGESIVAKINTGLRDARFVLAVISPAFLERNWTQKELHASLQLEVNSGRTRVLPLLVGSNPEIEAILSRLPLLADKKYLTWPGGPGPIVEELKTLLKP